MAEKKKTIGVIRLDLKDLLSLKFKFIIYIHHIQMMVICAVECLKNFICYSGRQEKGSKTINMEGG